MSTFYDEVQKIRERYPEGSRSASLQALRLAQEKHGYLTREAFEETADALDVTPAFCYSVATFYDMFNLEPVGAHTIEICTNLPCGLCGAQKVVEAFEQELGIKAGETTEDGSVTLARGRVPRRLRLRDCRRRRPPLPPSRQARGCGPDS